MTSRITERAWAILVSFAVLALCVLLFQVNARAQGGAQQILNDAAAALGGRERLLAVKTLLVEGGGHDFEVEQSLRYDEIGMQSDVCQIRDYKRAYDLVNGRARFEMVRHRLYAIFNGNAPFSVVQNLNVAAAIAGNAPPPGPGLPGPPGAAGAAGQVFEYLRHPLTLVRAALDPKTKFGPVRSEGNERLVDMTVGPVTVTAVFDSTTKLPVRVFRMTDSATMGDRAVETRFAEYKSVGGLQLPTRFTNKVDRWLQSDVRILRQAVDGPIGDLAALAAAAGRGGRGGAGGAEGGEGRGGAGQAQGQPASPPTVATELGKGIWNITGTTHHSMLAEFNDHLLLIEAPNVERALAVMAKAKELRPNKPVTKMIVTHHHGDHTSGVRTAVALGVNEIMTYKSNVQFLTEMFKRPHIINPDLFAKTPGAKAPKITAIDDEGVIKDSSMVINLYHLLDNTHADSQLMIYFPRDQIFSVADVYMPNDPRTVAMGEPLGHAPWNRNVLANINYRKLPIKVAAPNHGDVVPYSTFLENTLLATTYLPKTDVPNTD